MSAFTFKQTYLTNFISVKTKPLKAQIFDFNSFLQVISERDYGDYCVAVSIEACGALDPGSIPGGRLQYSCQLTKRVE